MPSAANVKIEKQIAPDNALADAGGSTPLRQAITTIEHKIRNLEKRKSKLESYRDLQRSGKDLNQDQKTAVAKYDEVVQTLEFARDLCKQFLSIAIVSEKDEKKKARKEAVLRSQTELTKIREVLLVQDALANMGQDTVREDFLNEKNGAASLSDNDLKLLDDLYAVVTPKHEAGDPTAFMSQVQASAEHLLAVVDGKPKEIFGATYSQIKEVIGKIHESGYLDQVVEPVVEGVSLVEMETTDTPIVELLTVQQMDNVPIDTTPQIPMQPVIDAQQTLPPPAPILQQQIPLEAVVPPMQLTVPDQMYFSQPPTQPRPITEVLGGSSFFFLQESELDTPPEQIPSQTFTNQTYVATPPPPIPMPPHFQQFPNGPQPQQPPVQQQPQSVIPPQQPPPSVQPAAPVQTNNGIGDHVPDMQEEVTQPRSNRHQPAQRSNNTAHHQQYYPNNNGYNRPNRNRNNGSRSNNRQNQ